MSLGTLLALAAPALRRPAIARRWSRAAILHAALAAEACLLLAAGLGVTLALQSNEDPVPLGWGAAASIAATAVVLRASGRRLRRPLMVAGPLLLANAAAGLLLLLLGAQPGAALDWAAADLVAVGLSLTCWRAAQGEIVARLAAAGRLATRVAVLGGGPAASRAITRLRQAGADDLTLVGRYADPAPGTAGWPSHARGGLRAMLCDCRLGAVDAVLVALEPDDRPALERALDELRPCAQHLYLTAELAPHAPPAATAGAIGPLPAVLLRAPPIAGAGGRAKRALDVVGALALLAFLAPLLLLIVAAIRLDSPGPILFRQLRVGYDNQLFYILKFRSMRNADADRLARQQTVWNDARVTRVGRIIRRLSLDELPQLLNILRGEMSLVGPRPHAPGTSIGGRRLHHLIDGYNTRHLVRPGITGLAQVRGLRGGLTTENELADRLAADLEYIETWSLWLDIKVLLLTTVLELRGTHGF